MRINSEYNAIYETGLSTLEHSCCCLFFNKTNSKTAASIPTLIINNHVYNEL